MTEVFEAKLRKIGNSLGVIIPSDIIEEMEYKEGNLIYVAIPPSDNKQRNAILMFLDTSII
jgi:antitoxin component of MazEF toxin-antitoxin module